MGYQLCNDEKRWWDKCLHHCLDDDPEYTGPRREVRDNDETIMAPDYQERREHEGRPQLAHGHEVWTWRGHIWGRVRLHVLDYRAVDRRSQGRLHTGHVSELPSFKSDHRLVGQSIQLVEPG